MQKIMFNEVWKDVVGFEGLYEVSNHGRVRRADTKRMKATPLNAYGYPQVNLYKDGVSHLYRVHRLVAIAFIPNPNGYECINHKDETPTNNVVGNLEWCDRAYNNNYGSHNRKVAISHSRAVLQYTLNGVFVREWLSATQASRELGIPQMAINSCCLHKPKYNQAKGFLWKYKDEPTEVSYKHGKRVIQFTANHDIVREFGSITDASKSTGISLTSITNCLHKRSKTAGGFIWEYKS